MIKTLIFTHSYLIIVIIFIMGTKVHPSSGTPRNVSFRHTDIFHLGENAKRGKLPLVGKISFDNF